jgi:hypothetical protein
MVASWVDDLHAALDSRERVFELGHTSGAQLPAAASELISSGDRELKSRVMVAIAQYVDAEPAGSQDPGQARGFLAAAEQHQRWIK